MSSFLEEQIEYYDKEYRVGGALITDKQKLYIVNKTLTTLTNHFR